MRTRHDEAFLLDLLAERSESSWKNSSRRSRTNSPRNIPPQLVLPCLTTLLASGKVTVGRRRFAQGRQVPKGRARLESSRPADDASSAEILTTKSRAMVCLKSLEVSHVNTD